MSATQVLDPADVICGLKAAVTALECYHNMNLLREQAEKEKPLPTYVMIPIAEEKDVTASIKSLKRKVSGHRELRTLKERKECNQIYDDSSAKTSAKCPPKAKFPEMRSGILYAKCYCMGRNGLQDSCPLSQCQGQEECLVRPWPICPPGKLIRSRYPELYPTQSDSDSLKCQL